MLLSVSPEQFNFNYTWPGNNVLVHRLRASAGAVFCCPYLLVGTLQVNCGYSDFATKGTGGLYRPLSGLEPWGV